MLKQLDVLIGFAVVMSLVSMLIMAISQMVLSGLQMRGKQMMDALEAMFATLKPDLAGKAKALAEAVLRHPVISDSAKSGEKRGLASAIRPQELLDILANLHASKGNQNQWVGAKTLIHPDTPVTIDTVAQAAGDVLAVLQQPDQAVAQANQQLSNFLAPVPGSAAVMQHLQTIEDNAKINVQSTLQRTEKWFNTAEDRAREWFATRAQQCNVVIGCLLAFGLQLDAITLYRQLENDDAYRTALVGSAAVVQKQAQDLREHADKVAEAANKDGAQADFDFWKKTAEDIRKQAAQLDKDAPTGFQLLPTTYPKNLWQWLGVAKRPSASGATTTPSPPNNSAMPTSPTPTAAPTTLPTPTPGFFSFANLDFHIGHLLGMLFFAALLSLGAPYWFNLLKTLTSFRPLLAQQVDKDKDRKQKPTAS
jgi:hypothetical protein